MLSALPGPPEGGSRPLPGSTPRVRVALDAMGGDSAPDVTVAGAVLAARELGIPLWLVGHEDVLQASLSQHDVRGLPITIHHAPDIVGMEESPVAAIRRKPRCSIRAALDLLHTGTVDAVVSAGNSGATVAGALFVVGRLPSVERPAIAVSIPRVTGQVILVDAGASVDADPNHLVQFAVMGQIYARVLCGIEAPRVGVLSNGAEESKGTETTRATSAALRTLPLNFIGYVEGRAICEGDVDVVVCDGFVGNAVLKAIEGFGGLTGELLRQTFRRNWRTRLGYFLVRGALAEMRGRLDYAEYGGAPLLGIDGVVIVAHGGSDPRAIRNAIRVAHDSAQLEVNRQIDEWVRRLPVVGSAGRRRRRLWEQFKGRLVGMRDGHGPSESDDQPEKLPADEAPA